MTLDNPASRLYELLAAARAVPNPTQLNAADGWQMVFELGPADDAGVLRCFSETVELAVATRAQVSELVDQDPELALENFGQVEAALRHFQQVRAISMQSFMQPLTDLGMYSLKMCASLLHRYRPERSISDSQRDSFLAQVRDLIAEVGQEPNLDIETRSFVLQRLLEVERALLRTNLVGHHDLERASYDLLLSMGTPARASKIAKAGEAAKKIFAFAAALAAVVATTAEAVNAIEGAPPAPAPIVKIIEQINPDQLGGGPLQITGPTTAPQ